LGRDAKRRGIELVGTDESTKGVEPAGIDPDGEDVGGAEEDVEAWDVVVCNTPVEGAVLGSDCAPAGFRPVTTKLTTKAITTMVAIWALPCFRVTVPSPTDDRRPTTDDRAF
jgi:hypothetical protein